MMNIFHGTTCILRKHTCATHTHTYTHHGLTKWIGSASQHLIAPLIFFLSHNAMGDKLCIMKLEVYHEFVNNSFQYPPDTYQTQTRGNIFLLGKIWLFRISLGHRLLLQVDEAVLPGRDQQCSWLELALAMGTTTESDTWQKHGPYWSCSFPIHGP